MRPVLVSLAAVTFGFSAIAAQAQAKKFSGEGISNFAHIDTAVACTGAIRPTSVSGIKTMAFASIFNLCAATETGADSDAEAAAARDAGINFVHLPFSGSAPDPAMADHFPQPTEAAGNLPAFIHRKYFF